MPVLPEKRGAGGVSLGELHHSNSTNGVRPREHWEHHYALMYGDRVEELTAFCRNMNIEMHLVK